MHPITINTIPMLIHIGLTTHHQDQSITLQSLSTMKAIVNNPVNLTPPEEDFDSLILFKFKIQLHFYPTHSVKMTF